VGEGGVLSVGGGREAPRLLFLCSTLTTGGFERHLSQLVPGLRDEGYRPLVVSLRHEGRVADVLREAGIDVRFADMRSRSDVRGMRRALSFAGVSPHVVISQSIDAHLLAWRLARRAGAPHIAVEHAAPELLRGRRSLHRLAYRWFAPRVDGVVAVSATQVPELLRLGYRADVVRVIPNGIPDLVPARGRAETRAELGLGDADFVVTLVATLRPEKRGPLFVDAVAAANAANRLVKGLVVGEGPDLERVRERAAASGGAVKVLGERSDISDLMNASDVIGLSSVAECLPLSVLEAMALARPVVGTDVGGMRDPVRHGETGLLVEPGSVSAFADAIGQLAADRDRAAGMGAAGRRRYDSAYTLGTMVESYSRLFREVREARSDAPRVG
jgi:glycosyltransferase involved in cell wall biosynthesis